MVPQKGTRERMSEERREPLKGKERVRVLALLSVPEPGDNIVVRAMRREALKELVRALSFTPWTCTDSLEVAHRQSRFLKEND